MTALTLFIVTFVIHPPTPKKEGNHIHPLILFPAVNSFTNEQQIIYTASNWQPPVLLSLSLPHKIIHSILLAQTFFFSHSVDLYLVFKVSRVLLPQLELLWSKNEDIETQFKIEEISSLSEI